MMKSMPVSPVKGQASVNTLVAVLLGVFSTVSIAEDASFSLEEVVVTAQKREQSLQDVPIAITAFGEDDLKRLNASDMSDLQYSTPNLTISTNGKNIPRVGLRGISDYSRNPGYDNRVSVYVDGMYAGRSAVANQSTLDIQRVEVLRGPQGTLFGKNTVAGAISLTTKKPEDAFMASIKVDAGNYDYQSLSSMINGALIDEKLYAKLMLSDTQRDGFKENLFDGKDLNGLDNQAARLQLRWLLDNGEVNFYAEKSKDVTDSIGSEALKDSVAPLPYEVSLDSDVVESVETKGYGVNVDYTLPNDFELTSITGYRHSDAYYINDEDYSVFDVARSLTAEESEHFSQEFRLSSPLHDKYDYVLGLYAFDQTNESQSAAIGGALFPNPNTSVSVPAEVNVESFAAFIHGNYRINEQWELTGGLRYTYETKELKYSITDTTGLFTNGSLDDDRRAEDLSPKLGVNYYVNEDVMLYGGYSRGFKSGGWNVDFIPTFETIAFDDEKVDAFELGIKSTLSDGRVRFNAAVYSANYSDFQVFQFLPLTGGGTLLSITNAGEVTAEGFEADINWAMTERLTLWAAYGYTDTSFDEFKDGGGIGVDYDGNQAPDAPKETYSVGLEYRQPIGDLAELVASADYSFRDEFYTNPNNLDANKVGDYDMINARVGLESVDETWSIYAWVKNAADADDLTDSSVSFLGIDRGNYLQPRTYGVSVEYRIGE